MAIGDKTMLYLVKNTEFVARTCGVQQHNEFWLSNWPGTLKIPIYGIHVGHHNWELNRYDMWFKFGGLEFWGLKIGDDHDCVTVKRIKDKGE